MNESIRHLEEKIAYLERHVMEQDKAMLEFADEIAALRRDFKIWRERASSGGGASEGDSGARPEERPPHY